MQGRKTETKTVANGMDVMTYEHRNRRVKSEVRKVAAMLPRGCEWVNFLDWGITCDAEIYVETDRCDDYVDIVPDRLEIVGVSVFESGGVAIDVNLED